MDRVLGVETEYGLSARADGRRLSAPEAAELLFRPFVAEHRASGAFLGNGGRLYLDVGAHPEYATPECRTPHDLLVAERAGDALVADLARRAVDASRAEGREVSFRLFRNNADSFGNSWGCHENYLVSRDLELSGAVDLLTTFLVTRQVLCGSGRLHRGEFRISQRADHLHDQLSALTTRARPLVNTRDEPLADAARFRRLHVLAGDSNLVEGSALLKVGTMLAVLAILDRPDGPAPELASLRLADPAGALRAVARDPLAVLDLADGRRASAIDLQYAHLDLAGASAAPGVAQLWARVLDALASPDPDAVADTVEWVAKLRLLREYRSRHGLAADDPRLRQLDLAFHELGGLIGALEAGGAVRRLTAPEQVGRAVTTPPHDTRAAARGRFIDAVGTRRHSVDWQTCTVHDLPDDGSSLGDRTVLLDDPRVPTSAALDDLLAGLG
ncbi:MAG: proteasome accessory factor PafA2 family protein [Propionicimonas sp.]|uniref:proteasome accessory factor PafA2 family protein n=1 Tax=Propionicimonas sp. TaxID=1955623 RepID=UPI003D0E07FA